MAEQVATPAPAPAPAPSTPAPSAGTVPAPAPASLPAGSERKSTQQIIRERLSGLSVATPVVEAIEEEEAPEPLEVGEGEVEQEPDQSEAEVQEESPEPGNGDGGFEEGEPEGEGFDFDLETEQAPTAPQELSAAIDKDPALKAAIEANPELRNKIFANARLASVAKEYGEVFANPSEARIAAEGHGIYSGVRDVLSSIRPATAEGGPESTQAVLNALFQATAVRDEEGQPVFNENGQVVTDGSVSTLLMNAMQTRLLNEAAFAAKNGDETTQAAIDHLMERFGGATSKPEQEDGDDALAQERAALRTERQRLIDDREAEKQQHSQAFNERIERAADARIDTSINSILNRVEGLNKFNRDNLDRTMRKGVEAAIRKDGYFATEFNSLLTMPPTAATEKKRVALVEKYLQKHLPAVAKPLLREAGITALAQQGKNKAISTARQQAAQSETRGSGRMAKPTGPMDAAALARTATEQLTRELGTSRPSTSAILARVAQLRAGQR